MKDLFKRIILNESGQGLVEYGLLIVLIIVVAVAALTIFGDGIVGVFGGLDGEINTAVDTITE
ncbi:MAG: Flp family type IVb pilin [Firmicutes bacterium]|nr:Flp family type IVb pilin [Bacillota bacterium]